GGSSVQAVITNREQLIETRGPQDRAYAVLHGDGTVRCGGSPEFGGDCSGVQDFLHDVQAIHSTRSFFVALQHDGYLVTWGRDYYEHLHILEDIAQLWCLVQSIATADLAVAALLKDGSVVCWGDAEEGGDCQAVQRQLRRSGRSVTHIRGFSAGFGAVCSDGSVVTWGRATLPDRLRHVRNVEQLEATEKAFAVRLSDGSVVAWGDPEFGGDCSSVGPGIVQMIVAGIAAFAALCQDGSVVSWGDPFRGGNRREIAAQHRGEVAPFRHGFVAILEDGSEVYSDDWASQRQTYSPSQV
ncbi:Vha26, partial [Symbiodinium necroappetens]